MRTQPRNAQSSHARAGTMARAFTVAELMIVLIILGVVLSVILPSIKHVNNRAKAAVTMSLISSVNNATGQFAIDHQGRNAGYYSAAVMGTNANAGAGLSAMQNILLDIMPGITAKAADSASIFEIQPGANADTIRVDLGQLAGSTRAIPGGSAKSYFRPDPKYYYAAAEPGTPATGLPRHLAGHPEHAYLPDYHDAYGTPLLAWQEDERAQGTPGAVFGLLNSDNGVARFYWASNACFLDSTALGKLMQNQRTNSQLGMTGAPGGTPERSLMGLLSNPAFPDFPLPRARGAIVFHSAGANGLFLGLKERGAINAGGTGGPAPLPYFPTIDPMKNGDFDDIVIGGGN